MKLKYRFLLASTSHFQSRKRFEMFCILGICFLSGIISNTILNCVFTNISMVFVAVIFAVYNLLIVMYDDLRFLIINATNDEEAHIRSLLRKI